MSDSPENEIRSKRPATEDRRPVDWDRIEPLYRAGVRSLKDIGSEFGVSAPGILKKAKKEGWSRDVQKVKDRTSAKVPLIQPDERDRSGFIYVIYMDTPERYCKIGMTADLGGRLKTHQCSSPFELFVACGYFVPNMRTEEAALHAAFADKRVRGEWFRLNEEDLKLISLRSLLVQ